MPNLSWIIESGGVAVQGLKAIFHWAEFSARSDIFFCLKIDWRKVGVKRKYHYARKILPIVENSPKRADFSRICDTFLYVLFAQELYRE